ncbi:MAG: hypothetical protein ABIV06_01315 [Thermoanaerobaculia bacterium]
MRQYPRWTAALWLWAAAPLAGQELPKVDISWTAEHLMESVQDSRLLSLPWPGHELAPGRWQRTVDLAWQSVSSDLGDASGFLVAGGATWGKSERFGWGGFAFYDRLQIAGDGARDLLRSPFAATGPGELPLALPAFAEFGAPRGEVRHAGAGGQAVWQGGRADGTWRRTIVAGAYFEKLDVVDFRFAYELVSGPAAGARGELDWSASYSFVTPFAGIGWTRSLGRFWTMTPRLVAGQPLPRQAVEVAISGPDFKLSGEGRGAAMGDGYLGAGLTFEHLPTGLAIDLGSSLWFAATEGLSHEGLTRATLVHLSWSF